MLIISGAKNHPRYTLPLYGLSGKYTLSQGVTLPYFLSAMPLERAIEELKVHEQISPSLDNAWTLRELFQREIDVNRVKADLVKGYLNDPNKLKFFNALTIVLMPKDGDGRILNTFADADYEPPVPHELTDRSDEVWAEHPDIEKRSFGGVQYLKIGDQARIRWNPEQVHAVAVDGQHRLRALQLYYENEKNRSLLPEEKETKIPVLFVLIAKQAGFENDILSIRSISRELFTDLNKNAKKVDRARELILDDWSIVPQCVRTLITEEAAQDSDEKLPLTLIRWQEPNNRFDQSYFLNSLVNLELLVNSILDLTIPKDPMELDEVHRFIKSITDSLSTESRPLVLDGRSLLDVYSQQYCEEGEPSRPFSRLPEGFLNQAVENFEQLHRPYILAILTRFRPYKNLLEFARSQNLIEGNFGKFLAQTKLHRQQIKENEIGKNPNWYLETIQKPQESIEGMKTNETGADWSFKAIFQKALIRLGKIVAFENSSNSKLGDVSTLIDFMDALHEKGVLTVERELEHLPYGLWGFIGLTVGGKIKVAKSTEDRILALLRLWYYSHLKLKSKEDALTSRKLLKYFSAKASCAEWPFCDEACRTLISAFDVKAFHGGKNPTDVPEKLRNEKLRARLAAVLAEGDVNKSLHADSREDESAD